MRGLPRNHHPGPRRLIFPQTSDEEQKKGLHVFCKVIIWNCYSKVTVKLISILYFREDISYFLSVTCIRLGIHESVFEGKLDVRRHEDLFFSPDFCGKITRRKREDLFFFGLHLIFGRKLDVGRREALVEMCLTVTF